MAFFVLSGIVIAYVTDKRERTATAFMSSRLARLWSVVLPAIVIVPMLDFIGMQFHAPVYSHRYSRTGFDSISAGALLTPFFLNQSWFASADLFSDVPIWSLTYEFFYYVIFCISVFARGIARLALTGVAILIFGPKALLLLPVWLSGVVLYRLRFRIPGTPALGATLMTASILFVLVGRRHPIQGLWMAIVSPFVDPMVFADHIKFAANFPWLNIAGALMFLHLAGAWMCLNKSPEPPSWLVRPIKAFADRSFAIYIFHSPVQFAIGAALWTTRNEGLRLGCLIGGSLALSFALGSIFEPMKAPIRTWLEPRLARLFLPFQKPAASLRLT